MSHRSRARAVLVPALGLLCAGVVAACGSSSATDDTTSSRSTTTVTRTETDRSATTSQTSTDSSTPATTTTGSSSSTAGGTHPCVAADLALQFLGAEGATGHGELGVALRNTSSAPCRTYGYPGVQFVAQDGSKLPTVPSHTTSDFFGTIPERAVTIAPGGRASFRLGVTHVPSGGGGCTTAHRLQVIAPDDTATMTVDLPSGGAAECGGRVTVSPVAPGTAAFAH